MPSINQAHEWIKIVRCPECSSRAIYSDLRIISSENGETHWTIRYHCTGCQVPADFLWSPSEFTVDWTLYQSLDILYSRVTNFLHLRKHIGTVVLLWEDTQEPKRQGSLFPAWNLSLVNEKAQERRNRIFRRQLDKAAS